MKSAPHKVMYAISGLILVPCFGRLALHGTGFEYDLYRYLIPLFVGGLAGYLIGFMKDKWAATNEDLRAANEILKKEIDEHKQVEEALLQSEEKYRSIFENAVEGFFQSTPEGRFISVNPAFARMLGYTSPEELITSVSDIAEQYYVNTEDRHRYMQLLDKAGSVEHFEFKARCKNGSRIWVSNSTRAIYDRNGKIVRYEGSVNDISLRKQAERVLRESEAKYRAMMESMNDPVYICTSDYRVEYMNPAMIKRIGRDAIGEYCFKALHDLDRKCSWCQHEKVQQGDYYEIDIISPKDNRFYHVSNSPIIFGDGSVSKMTVFRDTTKIKQMEAQLQQAQKMEALGTLAGGIVHDFNNILFPVLGYTEMLLGDIPENSPFQEKLQGILTGARRAGDLVKQILTFSRQGDYEMKPLRMQLVIKEVLKLIRSTLPATINISRHISNNCRLIMADHTQIHQIAMNLMTNAYHAMEDTGGTLTVNLSEIEWEEGDVPVLEMAPGEYICLTVADTGMGMDQGVLDRIFDPYFTTKQEGKGTGLGLSVVHGIVKDHGGYVSVHSESGVGTEFKVYLPAIQTESCAKESEKSLLVPKGKERVLLVDDEQQIVAMLKQMLERLGYQVTCRTSSIEALEAFRQNPIVFDLVITDMTMPNMTGEQLSRQLMEIRRDVPVILCTGFSEKMSKERAGALGIKSFLMKPVVMSDLANTIRKILEKK